MTKTYLGDGVYADVECGMIKLSTENGIETTNVIFLDPEVYAALTAWADRAKNTTEK
jgi:hypothetical protein